jgi:hypothetical protein
MSTVCFSFFFYDVEMETRASCLLGKCSITELHPSLSSIFTEGVIAILKEWNLFFSLSI